MARKTPSKPGQGITFRITSLPAATTQQPLNSLAYWGRLNTHRTPFVIEGRILSAYFEQEMPESSSDTDAPPFPNIPITSLVTTRTIYELKGDTMRLFIAEVANESDKLPTKMMTTPGSHSALFELKRKSKLASTAGKTP